MKTAIIGSVDLLPANDIEMWAKSIRQTGYSDDIILLSYRINPSENISYARLMDTYAIEILEFNHDEHGHKLNLSGPVSNQIQYHIWRMRFFHMWQFLTERTEYTHVINSDVRDVVFQRNPNEILKDLRGVIAPAEGVRMSNEGWNAKSIYDCFGPYVWELAAKDFMVYNCGSWGGEANIIKWLALTIYAMSHQRANPGDQPAFNLLMNGLLKECGIAKEYTTSDEWACQGDAVSNQEKLKVFEHVMPTVGNDGIVRNPSGVPYVLVHQYDRIPSWKVLIEKRLSL
jgi:hypothetical protein